MPGTVTLINGQTNITSGRQALAAASSYFNVTNPTPGTAIAYALQTAFSATANGLFLIQNKNGVGGKNIYVDRLKLIQTATAPATTTVMRFESFSETGLVLMTGNVATRTPVTTNGVFPAVTGALVQSFAAGAATIPAAVGSRTLIDVGSLQTGVAVLNDEYVVDFGSDGTTDGAPALTAARATDPARFGCQMAAVVIPPQTTSWLNMWWLTAATNTPSFEFSLTYAEL